MKIKHPEILWEVLDNSVEAQERRDNMNVALRSCKFSYIPDANHYPDEKCVVALRKWKHIEFHPDEYRTDVLENQADEFEQMSLDDYLA